MWRQILYFAWLVIAGFFNIMGAAFNSHGWIDPVLAVQCVFWWFVFVIACAIRPDHAAAAITASVILCAINGLTLIWLPGIALGVIIANAIIWLVVMPILTGVVWFSNKNRVERVEWRPVDL